ncbi:MAG: discoidin domain-containing protein [Phycisphaerae bacterium]|nr:discoidin domain-containing protein [Phycisphaerae bacterium]
MCKRSILAVFCLLLLAPVGSALAAADPTLVGWWWFNEGAGTVAADSSSYKNNGTLTNGATWALGKFGKAVQLDGVDDYVTVPHNPILCVTTGVTVMAWVNTPRWEMPGQGYQGVISKGNTLRSYSLYTTSAGVLHFSTTSTATNAYVGTTSSATVPQNQWVHVCAMVSGGNQFYYINGVAAGTNTGQGIVLPGTADTETVVIGRSNEGATRSWGGLIDDVRVYNRGMTQQEVQKIMTGADLVTGGATNPSPSDGATDVPQDTSVTWTAGPYAVTHDVYLGKTFADVNNASRTQPGTALVSQGQTATAYTPAAVLDYGQTYYWRVDEVNAAPSTTIFKGNAWSFTVEPYSYPITGITATASSSQPSMGPEKTVDGSGLTGDLHGIESTTMWMSKGTLPNWIQYEFDAVYKLDKLLVWNSNQMIETYIGFGAKDVTVEYSVDGVTWTTLAGVPEFARATGLPGYAANTTVDFGGALAKYVKLTIDKNYAAMATQTGLSEVRFTYIPVQARAPQPVTAATAISLDASLNWRPGREATSHQVFFGTDANAVANGTASAQTVTAHAFTPGSLNLGTTYYWKVDEIGGTGPYTGNVWSFTTQEYAVVDDFESYNDDDNRIYDTWIDGYTDGKSGSFVGYLSAPFAERTIVHGGAQSMPFEYNNVKAPDYSEATRTFDTTQNWTTNGADTLSLWFRGQAAGFADNGDGTFTMSSSGTDIWNNGDQFRFAYKSLNGDGTIVARVDSIVNTNVWAKGGVMIRQSIDTGSTHAFMPITAGGSGAGNGASFQRRLTNAGASTNDDNPGAAVAAPYWVKVERKGNSFTGSISPDGKTWTQLGTAQTIVMANPVLIGLALCSHDAALTTVAGFSNVSTTGTVTGSWQSAAIGVAMPTNGAAPLYLTVTDKAGKTKTVVNANPSASTTAAWTEWRIPLSSLTGVSLTAVQKITLGVGDKASPKAGAAGMMYFDDIGYGHPAK